MKKRASITPKTIQIIALFGAPARTECIISPEPMAEKIRHGIGDKKKDVSQMETEI
ncbi:MAG: hypothetical protein J5563_03110 [Clostridia bacterium]|nr:hypothetical protein [Clostridia bacterium]